MSFFYAILSVFAYALQNVLVAPIYRQVSDKLVIVAYRGLCISISCLPILCLVPAQDFRNVGQHLPITLLAAALAVIGTWAAISSVTHLTVGIANTLLAALSSLVMVFESVFFLDESISGLQATLIALVLVTILILGFVKSSGPLPEKYDLKKGFLYCALFGAFTGSSYFLIGMISRNSNPLLIGYAWETMIGVFAGLLILARKFFKPDDIVQSKEQSSSSKIFTRPLLAKLFVSTLPAGLGTIFYALAMTHGSIALASAVLNLCIVVTAVLSVLFFGEKLSMLQWILLSLICIFVTLMKVTF